MAQTIIGDSLPNIPWEDKPAGCTDVVWRHSGNPLIGRNPFPEAQGVYNSAVIAYEGTFIGVLRVEYKDSMPRLHLARSKDALHWEIETAKIEMQSDDPEIGRGDYTYDPRVCKIEDTYYITWCNDYHGPTIGIARTQNFETFEQLENAFLPFNRNGVLFPRKINGMYLMLSRPSDNGHTPFGDIYYSESPDLCYWGKHRYVMGTKGGWQSTKIGAGPIPIETTEGWLLIYHGVLTSCNGFVYSYGAALLDLEKPWKVLYRGGPYLMSPQALYECVGDTPNVAFPCAALVDAPTGRIAIYYGGADTVTCLAFGYVDELIEFVKTTSEL